MSQPRLPPELCDRVIDEVAESEGDREDMLSTMALICREWIPRVRYHRWSTPIEVEDVDDCFHTLVILVHVIPEIGPHIKTLKLAFHETMAGPSSVSDDVAEIQRPLFASCSSVHYQNIPMDLDATIREDARPEEILDSFFLKLINLVHLSLETYLTITPSLVRHFPNLIFLHLRSVKFKSLSELCKVLHALPELRKIFFEDITYPSSPSSHSRICNVYGPMPDPDELGVTDSPEFIADLHKIFLFGTLRPPVIDLSIGQPIRRGHSCQVKTVRERFMLSLRPSYDDNELDVDNDGDALYLNMLHPSIKFHEVELMPIWDDAAFSFIFSWLAQIACAKRNVKILIIRLCIAYTPILHSEDWSQITELLRARFMRVEQLIVRLLWPKRLSNGVQYPKPSTVASIVEEKLEAFAREGKLRFEYTDYCKCVDQGGRVVWNLLKKYDDEELDHKEWPACMCRCK
ncbi:hypothetical protein CERSUDRAFT_71630 [Gelatoporia subvermispora B]|uniref:F-box domain-containing protein n=1 Tax=Ceriporiopsis subvermispora (strain B) TaxID=914234 RepID=M2PSV9_CERS8|nr:hypothetical protein CERSUDRAFT_71630 [Gelatoporia subvermispora B]